MDALSLVHELIEALTAAGNYLTAARPIFSTQPLAVLESQREAFEKSMTQFQRANEAARRLRDFHRIESAGDDAGP